MSFDLRKHIATKGLITCIEGNFKNTVKLIDPDGVIYNHVGLITYDRQGIDPETGDEIVINETMVTLRKSALARIPAAGETWKISIPINPADPDTLTTHLLTIDEAPTDGNSIGFINLKPKEVVQS